MSVKKYSMKLFTFCEEFYYGFQRKDYEIYFYPMFRFI
jgi:hypothetical protein